MGTRGLVGFRIDGEDRLSYNHYDSYPSELGVKVVDFLQSINSLAQVKAQVRQLKLVTEDMAPTEAEIAALGPWSDLSVGEGKPTDWYCLLRQCQGDLKATLEAGYMLVNNEFINDSLFCEWAYIINLDTEKLEIYKGFQTKAHKKGRYGKAVPTDTNFIPSYPGQERYYPVALVANLPLKPILKGQAVDWESIECGPGYKWCLHLARKHFPKALGSNLRTRTYLGLAPFTFRDAIAFIYKGKRYISTGGGGRREYYAGNSTRRLGRARGPRVTTWEANVTAPNGRDTALVVAVITPKGRFKPASGVTWVYPPTKDNPAETLYDDRRMGLPPVY